MTYRIVSCALCRIDKNTLPPGTWPATANIDKDGVMWITPHRQDCGRLVVKRG